MTQSTRNALITLALGTDHFGHQTLTSPSITCQLMAHKCFVSVSTIIQHLNHIKNHSLSSLSITIASHHWTKHLHYFWSLLTLLPINHDESSTAHCYNSINHRKFTTTLQRVLCHLKQCSLFRDLRGARRSKKAARDRHVPWIHEMIKRLCLWLFIITKRIWLPNNKIFQVNFWVMSLSSIK